MKNTLSLVLTILCLLCVGCTSTKVIFKKPPINAPSDDASIKLAEAASSISDSMLEVAKVEKVLFPPNRDNTLTIPNAYNLQARASVDWSGPIEELTARIAKAAHFRLECWEKNRQCLF